jgi:hypothetical protein
VATAAAENSMLVTGSPVMMPAAVRAVRADRSRT